MKAPKKYPSTRFVLLQDNRGIVGATKRKYFLIGAVIGIVFFGTALAYIYYKTLFVEFRHSNDLISSSPISQKRNTLTENISDNLLQKISIKWEKFSTAGHSSETVCEDHQPFVIPGNNTAEYTTTSNLDKFLTFDLIFHYHQVINDHDISYLRIIFNKWRKELSISNQASFKRFLKSLQSNKLKFYMLRLKELNYTLEMNNFKYFYSLTEELSDWYVYLDDLLSYLSNYEKQSGKNYEIIKTVVSFQKFVNKTQSRLYHIPHTFSFTEKKRMELNAVIIRWMARLKIIYNKSTVIFYNKAVLLSEVNDRLKALNISSIESVYIFASHSVYLDQDLLLPGINVGIVAPNWMFLKKIKLNLGGTPGKEYEAPLQGQNGSPGRPGKNSGDFVGVGDINEHFLHVSCNGGSGGKGQNGSDGASGVNGTLPGPPIDKPSCVYKLNSFKDLFGRNITHYRVFNEKGCGGSGAGGGIGGIGGKGGRIVLLNKSKLKVTMGLDGPPGQPGKGGKGGSGGQSGCFYEVLDLDDKVLRMITKVKCTHEKLPSGSYGQDNKIIEGLVQPSSKVNISVSDVLLTFLNVFGEEFTDSSDSSDSLLFIKQFSLYNSSDFIFKQYMIYRKLNKTGFYKILQNTIDQTLKRATNYDREILKYLKTVVLGKILISKKKDFMFIDFESYLDTLEGNIKIINENIVNYPTSPVKLKIVNKLKKLRENFINLKSKFFTTGMEKNKFIESIESPEKYDGSKGSEIKYKNLTLALQERRVLRVELLLLDLIICFVNRLLDQMCGKDEFEFEDCLSTHLNSLRELQREAFESIDSLASKQKQILSRISVGIFEFEDQYLEEVRWIPVKTEILNQNFEMKLLDKIKRAIDSFTELDEPSKDRRILLYTLISELDNLIGLFPIVEWQELEQSFLKALRDLKFDERSKNTEFLKNELREVMIMLQYVSAVDAAQLKIYPLKKLERGLLSSDNIAQEAVNQINYLKSYSSQTPLCQNMHEAVFNKNSSIGEFYVWPNYKIRSNLISLFKGEKIRLKADLINHHVLDKNFIKFKSLKLEFGCEGNKKHILNKLLNRFRLEITHSGYSYYNWRGKTVVAVSEELTFDYGLKILDNGEPEVYNTLFKKLQKGEIMLSPYTTWTIGLIPLRDSGDFHSLSILVDHIDLSLTGTGVFVS